MSIGTRIKELRESAGLTQEQLAKKIGVTKSAVGNYEQNISSPKESVLYKLIDVLKCDANYIFQDGMHIAKNDFICSPSEQEHIKKYRELNDEGKEVVDLILEREYKFMEYRKKIEEIKKD